MTERFKSPTGQFITKSIFWEYDLSEGHRMTVYTLKDKDHKGYPSLKALYLSETDLTEYSFAKKNLHSWKHWNLMKSQAWFREMYQEWREELEVKLMSENLRSIQQEAQSEDGRNRYNANKYLLEQGWIPKKGGVGRTTKDKIQKEANKIFSDKRDVDEDYKRIMN